jgi:hypothetical protein
MEIRVKVDEGKVITKNYKGLWIIYISLISNVEST